MEKNQSVLTGVVFALVIVIGILVYDRPYHETLGERVGDSIDRVADDLHEAVERKR